MNTIKLYSSVTNTKADQLFDQDLPIDAKTSQDPNIALAFCGNPRIATSEKSDLVPFKDRALLTLSIPAEWHNKNLDRIVTGNIPEVIYKKPIPSRFIDRASTFTDRDQVNAIPVQRIADHVQVLNPSDQVDRYLDRLGMKSYILEDDLIDRPSWLDNNGSSWRITINGFSFPFFTGSAVEEIKIADLLYSLLLDRHYADLTAKEYLLEFYAPQRHLLQTVETLSHEEWLQAEESVKRITENTRKLELLFNDKQIATLDRILTDY